MTSCPRLLGRIRRGLAHLTLLVRKREYQLAIMSRSRDHPTQRNAHVACRLVLLLHALPSTTGLFDRASGVLKSCFDKVTSFELFCYGAPSTDPVPCACPGTQAVRKEL